MIDGHTNGDDDYPGMRLVNHGTTKCFIIMS